MKVYKIYISICVFFTLNLGFILAAPPVLYPNFPKFIGPSTFDGMPWYSTTLAEIDSIPGSEIVMHLADGNVYVWDYKGNIINGFPKFETPFPYAGSSVADLDGDGKNEIVNITLEGWLDVIDGQGNSWPNFPLYTGIYGTSPPVLADLDNDGKMEIIFYNIWGKDIHVYKSNGEVYPNWPKFISSWLGFVRGGPAIGDLDGDGFKDIVAFTIDSAFAWKYTGELIEGWPRAATDTVSTGYEDNAPPVLVDLDKDGKLEVVASRLTGSQSPYTTAIEVYNWKGEILPGWPRYLNPMQTFVFNSGPVVGDLDKDGSLEIVIYTWGYLNILKTNGEFYPGWPLETYHSFRHQPILVDLDNDDSSEILLVRRGNYITGTEVYAYSLNGTLLDGYPFTIAGSPILNAPAVADVDDSDSLSLLIVTEWGTGDPGKFYAYVYLYNLGVPYDASSVQWGTYGHNNRRTNNYHDSDICNAKPGDANSDTVVAFSDIIKIVDYLFRGDTLTTPKCAFDPNFDRKIRLSDVVFLINYLFKDGIPPIPYDDCCVGN